MSNNLGSILVDGPESVKLWNSKLPAKEEVIMIVPYVANPFVVTFPTLLMSRALGPAISFRFHSPVMCIRPHSAR